MRIRNLKTALRGNAGGHAALAAAYLIYGVNLVTTKDLSNSSLFSPAALFYLRVAGAAALFWIVSLFLPREKVSKKDMLLILPASFLGLFLMQYLFLEGIALTTPFDSGLVMTLGPVFTLIFAYFFVKEPITWKKIAGILLSLAGVVLLLAASRGGGTGASTLKGLLCMGLSMVAFALYLGIFQPLIQRYSVVTFNKWVFLYALVYSLPVCIGDVVHTDYAAASPALYAELGYLVVFATFFVYFLIAYGQQRIPPTTVAMYTYIQPVIAAILGVTLGMERITWQKAAAVLLVFFGVALVSGALGKPRRRHFPKGAAFRHLH